MVAGITAFVLVLCNGIILGRPKDEATDTAIEISLQIGYFVACSAASAWPRPGTCANPATRRAESPRGSSSE